MSLINPQTGRNIKYGGRTHRRLAQMGGVIMSPDQKAQYDRLLPEDRDEIRNWLLQQLHPNSLVYEILAWLDENVGLRLDQNTIRELLDQNRDELRQLIAQRLAN